MPQNLPDNIPPNCSIMLGEALDKETDPCHNIKDRYNRSGKYHILPVDYVPQENYEEDETN